MPTLNFNHILILIISIYIIGLIGIMLNRKNILTTIIFIELLLLSVNFNFATFSIHVDDIIGQIFILFVLTIAATETATGLNIITIFYRIKNSIKLEPIKKKFNYKN